MKKRCMVVIGPRRKLFSSKKGAYFFILDVLIGIFIFLVTILLISTFRSFTPSLQGAGQTIDNVYTDVFLTEIQQSGVSNTALEQLKANRTITNYHLTLDEVILQLYYRWNASSNTTNYEKWKNVSKNLIGNATRWLPSNYGVQVSFFTLEDTSEVLLYEQNSSIRDISQSTLKLSRKKITYLTPNITFSPPEEIAEVLVWQ